MRRKPGEPRTDWHHDQNDHWEGKRYLNNWIRVVNLTITKVADFMGDIYETNCGGGGKEEDLFLIAHFIQYKLFNYLAES